MILTTRCENRMKLVPFQNYVLTESERIQAFEDKRDSVRLKRLQSPDCIDDENLKKKAKRVQSKKMNNLHKVVEKTKDKDLQDFINELSESLKQFEKLDPSLKMIVRSVFNDNDDHSEQFKSVPIGNDHSGSHNNKKVSQTAEQNKNKQRQS